MNAVEQVEVAIRQLVAGQLVERGVRRFEERHERALAGEVARASSSRTPRGSARGCR